MQYQERVQTRLERDVSRGAELERESIGAVQTKPQSLEEIRRQARENWLRLRQESNRSASNSAANLQAHVDDDHLSR